MADIGVLTGLDDLPVYGDLNVQPKSIGNYSADLNFLKTIDGKLGSITPSVGYQKEFSSFNDGPVDVDNENRTIRIGLDGQTSLGQVDLSGTAMGSRTRQRQEVSLPNGPSFRNSNVGTFTRLGMAAKYGAFDAGIRREKSTGMEPVYSGNVGMNFGNGGRFEISDTNKGDPTYRVNYRMDF